jgi:transposase
MWGMKLAIHLEVTGVAASISVFLSDHDRGRLEFLLRSGKTEQRLVKRIGIVLTFSEDLSVKRVAGRCGCTMETARLWRDRWVQDGLEGLSDAPGRGCKPKYIGDEEAKIIAATLEAPEDETHWSARRLAKKVKASKSTVQRIWNRNRLQPHLQKTFKYSNDPQLVEKVVDVVGLYLNPPEKALVLSIDEKSQIQALNRTQPLLPLKFGHPECRTHDYERNGTTTLFAALNVATGEVVGKCKKAHKHQDFLHFLRIIDETYPQGEIHLILDNYATHKQPKVKTWFACRPRYVLHFTPTSASWMNQIETWFSILTRRAVRRGSFKGVTPLRKSIHAFIDQWNEEALPFKWVKTANQILAKAVRA